MVIALAKAEMLGFFGAAGLGADRVEQAVHELPPVVGPIVLDHINNHGPASYRVGETAWLFAGRQPGRPSRPKQSAESSSATTSTHEPSAAQPCSPSPDRYPPPSSPTRQHQYRQGRRLGQACRTRLERLRRQPHGPPLRPIRETTPARERAGELDYRLCCMPRTMRISRTPPSTWAVPSATKPCLR